MRRLYFALLVLTFLPQTLVLATGCKPSKRIENNAKVAGGSWDFAGKLRTNFVSVWEDSRGEIEKCFFVAGCNPAAVMAERLSASVNGTVGEVLVGGVSDAVKERVQEIIRNDLTAFVDHIDVIVARQRDASSQEIRKIVTSALDDLDNTIDHIADRIDRITSQFTPERIFNDLVEPTSKEIIEMERLLFIKLNEIIDKVICKVVTGPRADVAAMLQNISKAPPMNPFPVSKCRQSEGLGRRFPLNTIELYNLAFCEYQRLMTENSQLVTLCTVNESIQLLVLMQRCELKEINSVADRMARHFVTAGSAAKVWCRYKD